MSNIGLNLKNGIVIGENTRIQGTTLSLYDIVSINYVANVQVDTSGTIIDTTSTQLMRSAKYQVQIVSGSDYQTSEILLIQDGATSKLTEYGVLTTGGVPLATFTTDIDGSNVLLRAQMNSGTGSIWFNKTSLNTVQAELRLADRTGAVVTDRTGTPLETRIL